LLLSATLPVFVFNLDFLASPCLFVSVLFILRYRNLYLGRFEQLSVV
jgi:hypothetical protein